jgi:RNA recognition motif-containing protein
VEFETTEEARYAQTKATKPLNGKEIEIEFLTGATLWVTNYPPTADEKYIRNLFKNVNPCHPKSESCHANSSQYGEISEVRFPSLQGNTNRRFCYVQFLDASAAKKATELDGKVLDGQFHLGAKISDPNRKEIRHGALYEGREVYVRNISWKASEDDVKRLFQEYGTIEKVRIPVNDYGKSKGVAFVAFERANDAKKAVESLNNTPFMSRTINVEQSVPRAKRTQTTLLRGSTHSASPEPTSVNGDAMMVDGPINSAADEKSRPRKRTMALLNVPDTVNSARLEALLTPFGTINKITLRPDHGGAIVEFGEEKSVGAAGLGLGGTELDGKTIQTGTVADLMTHKAEIKAGKLSEVKKVKEKTSMLNQGPVSRPGGRRGGLGKRTGLGFSAPRASKPAEENGENGSKPAAKSNADFRSMFIKAKGNGDD